MDFELTAGDAAAELRRLAEVNAELLEALEMLINNNDFLVGNNAALALVLKAKEQ